MNSNEDSAELYFYLLYFGASTIILIIYARLPRFIKRNIFKIALFTSFLWIPLAVYFTYQGITRIIETQQISFLNDLIATISALLILGFYATLTLYPAEHAQDIVLDFFQLVTEKLELKTVWNLITNNEQRKKLFFILLLVLVPVIGVADIVLYSSIHPIIAETDFFQVIPIAIAAVFIVLIVQLVFSELIQFYRVPMAVTQHKNTRLVSEVIHNVAIAAGIPPPRYAILQHEQPNAFTLQSPFSPPTIYITNSLINIATRRELEAVVAHEIAHILSGTFGHYQIMQLLLKLIRIGGYFLWLFILMSINPILFFVWSAVLAYVVFSTTIQGQNTLSSSGFIPVSTVFALFNPPYVLVNFLLFIILYSITINEDLYADIKSVLLTRFPKPLYSLLHKLRHHTQYFDPLPSEYCYLYFVQPFGSIDIPPLQPSFEQRLSLLEDIDNSLHENIQLQTIQLPCVSCGSHLKQLTTHGHYGRSVELDWCDVCGGMWFDDWELIAVADLTSIQLPFPKNPMINRKSNLVCPRDGVELTHFRDFMIPDHITLWYCRTCHGNWLSREDVYEYGGHRKIQREKKLD